MSAFLPFVLPVFLRDRITVLGNRWVAVQLSIRPSVPLWFCRVIRIGVTAGLCRKNDLRTGNPNQSLFLIVQFQKVETPTLLMLAHRLF